MCVRFVSRCTLTVDLDACLNSRASLLLEAYNPPPMHLRTSEASDKLPQSVHVKVPIVFFFSCFVG